MTQSSDPLMSPPPTPPQRGRGKRWLRWTVGSLVAFSAVIAIAATLVAPFLVRAFRMEREIWTDQSGLPTSPEFRYLLFPTNEAIAFDDAMLTRNPSKWERVLLNQLPEQDARAISARDTRTGVLRYVDGATMALVPEDPADVQPALDAFIELVGRNRDPRIEWLRFDVSEQDGGARVTLEVADTRSANIYEYSVADGRVIPRRWTRRWRDW